MTVAEAARALDVDPPAGGVDVLLTSVATDTRALAPGALFVALKGERFDAHEFLDGALAAGAGALVVERGRGPASATVPVLEVADTLHALGDLAAAWRRRFRLPVLAVTGSNGKTTTKEIARAVFTHAWGEEAVVATRGNLNNLIGMPLTALRVDERHRAAVFEMGMNAPGEIARMVAIGAPTVGLITCVAEAHLEGLGSIEGVARAKGELFEGLPADATAIVNTDDPLVAEQAERFSGRRLTFGSTGEVRAEAVELDGLARSRFRLFADAQSVAVELPLGGRHNVQNALGAAAAAIATGLSLEGIAEGLATVEPPPMRLRAERLDCGVLLINDAYNANPGSVAASLGVLGDAYAGRNVVVLGDMRELGPQAARLHEETGRKVAAARPRLLAALGEFAADVIRGALDAGIAEAVAAVWQDGDAVLVKGSRGSEMERVAEELMRRASGK